MIPQTDNSWRDYRSLNQNWSYQPTLIGRVISRVQTSNYHFTTLTWDFIAFNLNIISIRKRIADTVVVIDVMYAPKYKYTCGHIIFMARRYPLNNSDIM